MKWLPEEIEPLGNLRGCDSSAKAAGAEKTRPRSEVATGFEGGLAGGRRPATMPGRTSCDELGGRPAPPASTHSRGPAFLYVARPLFQLSARAKVLF